MTQIEDLKIFADEIKGKFIFDYDLKKTNWLNIGGKAKVFFKKNGILLKAISLQQRPQLVGVMVEKIRLKDFKLF